VRTVSDEVSKKSGLITGKEQSSRGEEKRRAVIGGQERRVEKETEGVYRNLDPGEEGGDRGKRLRRKGENSKKPASSAKRSKRTGLKKETSYFLHTRGGGACRKEKREEEKKRAAPLKDNHDTEWQKRNQSNKGGKDVEETN